MDNKVLLAKSITLLYRESLLPERTENSIELVRTVLSDVKVTEMSIGVNTDKEIITSLKDHILEMCGQPQDHVYNVDDLLQRARINCCHDEKLFEAIKQGVSASTLMDTGHLKSSIVATRKSINNHYKLQQLGTILRKASSTFTYEIESIKDINQFISDLTVNLEQHTVSTTAKDPAVMEEIDIEDDTHVRDAFTAVKDNGSEGRIYRLGWTGLNEMTQEGLRAGEFVTVLALQHKYKTGFSMTLFDQIARYNKPKTKDPNKKPLLLRISFEDSVAANLQFTYQRLKYDETGEYVDIKNVSAQEMADYVKTKLQLNGFTIKMLRVDPTQWTYKSIFNKVLELEAQGYSVEVMMLDYLGLIPTTGCITTGAGGTDIRDLFRRVRNFASARGILCITPHQCSPDAKMLLRGGLPEVQFVKEIAEKGFYAGCKQLDQEIDLELYIHLFKYGKDVYLAVQRGKHRLPTVISEEKKFFLLKFPQGMPIPDSREGEPVMRKLSSSAMATEDAFDFG